MHTKTLVHVATEKKVCDIEEHFGIMILEYVKNMTSINLINESTATVEMTTPKINEMLNKTSNKKIEMLNDQASKEKEMLIDQTPKNQKREEKMPCSTTISESITHEKSDKKHLMKLNQSDEEQQNLLLNNSHSSRQIDSEGDEDHLIKTLNDDLKERFIKTPNMKNVDFKKHKKSRITNQKEMKYNHRKTHYKNSNRTEKA
jgi:hypothetical protein